jgi:signal transduction histidine kinase
LLDALKNPADARRIDRTYTALVNFSANIREQITQRQSAADQKFHLILATVALLATAVMCTAIFVGVKQYRSVMRPLGEIQSAVRRFASGEFTQRVAAAGDAEFVSLASDFNRMADELAALYGELENRVQTKSRQLVQSERLASLGYLAAGVAHEINNPLGIISGYAERSLQRIDVGWSEDTANYVRKTISIMCDEAFRCKAITDRLLMLARPGEQTRKNISLLKLTQEVVSSLGGLQRFADRRITIQTQSDSMVFASEGELKQVIMNLLVNALEASPAGSGQVHVTIAGGEHFVELSVADNGRGMNDQTRQQVFEPFFTQKRSDRPGTGLGLSVAHAIVSDHGGTIEAHSEGLGMGSVFVVRLPLSQEKVEVHDASAC